MRRLARCVPALALMLLLAPAAAADQQRLLDQMVDLNKKALQAYKAGKHDVARTHLLDALVLGKQGGLAKHDMSARTFLHLGVVYVAGLDDRAKGLRYFALALKLKPDIQITPTVVNAKLGAAFDEARRRGPELVGAETPAPAPGPTPAALTVAADKEPGKAEERPAAPEAKPEEPDLPMQIPQPLYCPTPTEGPPGEEITLRCLTQAKVKAAKVVVFYRPASGEEYTTLKMGRTKKGWYTAIVPAAATADRSLHFYFEAQGAGDKVAARNGKSDLPNVLVIREGASAVGQGATAALQVRSKARAFEDTPLEQRERDAVIAAKVAQVPRRAPRAVWVGLGLGSGMGWHLRRELERHAPRTVTAGFSPGGLMHLSPEVGFQWSERLAIALQTRHQYIPATGSGDGLPGSAPKTAHAVFAHAYYALAAWKDLQFLGTGTLGGGSAFRMAVRPGADLASSDTIAGGPIALGPGAALAYNFSNKVIAAAEARTLVGVWKLATMLEVTLGAQVAF